MTRVGMVAHQRGAMALLAESKRIPHHTSIEQQKEPIVAPPMEHPPRRLSIDPNSPDYHPCYVRVGVRVDGEERVDLQWYDVDRNEILTTAKSSHLVTSIEPYWRREELRNERRWRERWEAKRTKRA